MALSEGSRVNTQQYQQMLLDRWICRIWARMSTDQCKWALVGSSACDIDIRNSDIDVMLTHGGIIIEESSLVYREDMPCYVRISTSQLRGKIPNVLLGDGEYVLADPLRDISEELFGETIAEMTAKMGNSKVGKTTPISDFVPQLRTSGMPRTDISFLTRQRSWPCNELVYLIANGEFHLVARPAPYKPDRKHDFCLSFSKAETILTKAMSANQVLCMRWLKRIRPYLDGGLGVLTSYHIKTIFLWYSERMEIGVWKHKRPVFDILRKLDRNLEDKLLPHYFVPSMNLFTEIEDTDLEDVRMRLQSFFGFSLVALDLTGINDHSKMLLTMTFMDVITCMEANGIDQTSRNRHREILKQAENVYMNTCNKANGQSNIVKGVLTDTVKLSHSILEDYNASKLHEIRLSFVRDLIKVRKQVNEAADGHETVQIFLHNLNRPLGGIWPLKSIEPFISTGGHTGTAHQHRRRIMNNWLSFTGRVICRLKSHANYIIDHLLVGIWIADKYESLLQIKTLFHVCAYSKQSGCVSDKRTNYCELDIDKLFSIDHVTNTLLCSAINAAKELHPALDFYTYSRVPTWTGDATADLNTLSNVMERLFVPVEYAILTNIGLNTSDTSHYNVLEHMRMLDPESLEYQCASAFIAAMEMNLNFILLHLELHLLHGRMQFVTETSHSAQR